MGIIIGLGLSPLATQKPQDILISPLVENSLAQPKSDHIKPKKTFSDMLSPVKFLSIQDKTPKDFSLKKEEPQKPKIQGEILGTKTVFGQKTIAVLGDSMVDTMGRGLPYLRIQLKKYYPNIEFNLLNYGAAGTNIEYGLHRLSHDYDYLGEHLPSLLSQNPDIVVVESFAYNPWSSQKHDLDRHWLTLASIITTLKERSNAKIITLATIAPNDIYFGDGIGQTPWTLEEKKQKCDTIRAYLENTINFAQSQGYPLVDAYHPSKSASGEGKREYISYGDNLHPSVKGNQLLARLIAKKIFQLGLI